MFKKISYLAVMVSAVISGHSMAAVTFTPGAQPAVATFGGSVTVPNYKVAWQWGSNNLTGVNNKLTDMDGDKKTITIQGVALPEVTLIAGYTRMGKGGNGGDYASVSWGGGITSTITGEPRGIRKLTLPIEDGTGVKIGTAEIHATGLARGLGTTDMTTVTMANHLVIGMTNADNPAARSLCGALLGGATGMAGNTSQDGVPAADFTPLYDRAEKLMVQAGGMPVFPAANQTAAAAALNNGIANLAAIIGAPTVTQTNINFYIATNGNVFELASTSPNYVVEQQCGFGFSGGAGEKIVLKFDAEITKTTQWKIMLAPIITYT